MKPKPKPAPRKLKPGEPIVVNVGDKLTLAAVFPSLAVEDWPIARPQPYAKNARKLSDRAVDVLAASIREFGFRQPIVVDAFDVIVVGHTRLLAAQKLGLATVPVHVASSLTPAQCKAYRLADNRTADETSWDEDALRAEFAELQALEIGLDLTAFEQMQITELTKPAGLVDEDDAPEPPVVPVSQLGDLWLLGSHRVLCGDATDADAVARLMGDTKPLLMVTDPPFGVGYDPSWRNDALHDFAFRAVATAYMKEDKEITWLKAHKLFTGNVAYVWHADRDGIGIQVGLALIGCGFTLRTLIIWVKEGFVISRGHYNSQHESCWYACRKGTTANWHGGNSQSSIWNVNRIGPDDSDRTGHAAQKPVELMRRPILNHTIEGEHVYDPFLGSGTTLMACHLTQRGCIGRELDPAFIDVIVARWQAYTGLAATLDGDGRTFDAIKAARAIPAIDAAA